MILRFLCKYHHPVVPRHHMCTIFRANGVCWLFSRILTPFTWQRVALEFDGDVSFMVEAIAFWHDISTSRLPVSTISQTPHNRIANSVQILRFGEGLSSPDLIVRLINYCPSIKRLDAPVPTCTPLLGRQDSIRALSLMYAHGAFISFESIAEALSTLNKLEYLQVETNLCSLPVAPSSLKPTFRLLELTWATNCEALLRWVLENSTDSLKVLSLWRRPSHACMRDIFSEHGAQLQAIRIYNNGSMSESQIIELLSIHPYPNLRELICNHPPHIAFLAALLPTIQHIVIEPFENMEEWETDTVDQWIRSTQHLRVLTLFGQCAGLLRPFFYGDLFRTGPGVDISMAEKVNVLIQWEAACTTKGIDLRFRGDGRDWCWVSCRRLPLDRN